MIQRYYIPIPLSLKVPTLTSETSTDINDWCKGEDVAKLEAENERLKKALEEIKIIGTINRLSEECFIAQKALEE